VVLSRAQENFVFTQLSEKFPVFYLEYKVHYPVQSTPSHSISLTSRE